MKNPSVLLFAAALSLAPLALSQTFPKSVQKKAAERSSYPGALAATPSVPAVPQSLADRRAALNSLFNEVWQDRLTHHPLYASAIGDHRYDADIPNLSVAAFNAALDRGRQYLLRLGVIDTTGFSPEELLSDDLLVRQLVQQQQAAQFKPWQMPITPYTGPQVQLLRALPQLRFASAADYDNYAARLGKLPAAFDQATTNAAFGIEAGRVPPKSVLQQVLAQVNAVAQAKPGATPFAAPLQHFPASISAADQKRIRTEILTAIRTQVQPAYVRLGLFLTRTYIPAGSANAGLWSIPAGDAYYKFLVHQSTTTDLTAEQINQLGLKQVEQDEAAILTLAQKLGLKDLAALRAAATNPKLHAQSEQQLSDLYKKALAAMPATLPAFRRYATYNAYIHGWALYTAQLATNSDPYQTIGRIELDRRHAALAVIDTGIHFMHWTRPQALDYLRAHTLLSDAAIQSAVGRVIAQPAQSLGATIGAIELTQLRALAQKSLGSKFSLAAFNNAVLHSGPLPMDILQHQIEQWIARQKGSGQ